MKQKTLILILASIFLIGIVVAGVGADREISNTDGIYIKDFVAGTEVQANFSYYYIRDMPDNPDNSPLVLKISVNSSDENYPVWKKDFSINGYIERWNFLPWFIQKIPFSCFEDITEVVHPLGSTTIEPKNGTFYCFDPEGEMDFADFNTRDEVFLNILSHPALYPGQYNLLAEFYYVEEQSEDEYIQTVNIDAVDDSNVVPYGQDSTVIFNMTLEIKGGNALKMKMSNLINQYGDSYSAEYLNARLIYDGVVYNVREDYWEGEPIIFPWTNETEELVNANILFNIDIKSGMEPGNYHGTYQFNVTKEDI
jgi:hypothetical protein